MDKNKPIDIVITWVDGNDPVHRKKRNEYSESKIRHEDIDGETRFVSVGEIAYCIASINRFASFVRKIFIVTDQQDPGIAPDGPLTSWLKENFEQPIPMEIIDHKVIFEGYEQYLPTFNSLSIETLLWKIPGLSDDFVYFNDDVILIGETSPETWFKDGKTNVYGYWHKRWTAALLRALRLKKHGHKEFTFRDSLLNGADVAGAKKNFFRLTHTPHAMNRSLLETFYNAHPEVILRNISHRFRDAHQFNPQAMFQNFAIAQGQANILSTSGLIFYMRPREEENYMQECIRRCEAISTAKFLCVNSLDQANEIDRQLMLSWIASRIGVKDTYKA